MAIRDERKVFSILLDTVLQLGLRREDCVIVLGSWYSKVLAHFVGAICHYRNQPRILRPTFASHQLSPHRFNWRCESADWASCCAPRGCTTSHVCSCCVMDNLKIEAKLFTVRHYLQNN